MPPNLVSASRLVHVCRVAIVFLMLLAVGPSRTMPKAESGLGPTTETLSSNTRSAPIYEVTLQQGVLGYDGCEDTHISAWAPLDNLDGQGILYSRPQDTKSALVYFDMQVIPSSARIRSATLELYCLAGAQEPIQAAVFAVLRRWVADEATWTDATLAHPWSVPGCAEPGVDRSANIEAEAHIVGLDQWYAFSITGLAQDWHEGRLANYGVVLKALSGPFVEFGVVSADHVEAALRPRLRIEYVMPSETQTPTTEVTSTPTMSPTQTPTRPTSTPTTGPSETATATATPWATISPTAAVTPQIVFLPLIRQDRSPTSTPTMTPTGALTMTPTATRMWTPTATLTATPTATWTWIPTATPTDTQTATPTGAPTETPTPRTEPSGTATATASPWATVSPTTITTPQAMFLPMIRLDRAPTATPTMTPTPTPTPTLNPTEWIDLSLHCDDCEHTLTDGPLESNAFAAVRFDPDDLDGAPLGAAVRCWQNRENGRGGHGYIELVLLVKQGAPNTWREQAWRLLWIDKNPDPAWQMWFFDESDRPSEGQEFAIAVSWLELWDGPRLVACAPADTSMASDSFGEPGVAPSAARGPSRVPTLGSTPAAGCRSFRGQWEGRTGERLYLEMPDVEVQGPYRVRALVAPQGD